MTRLERARIVRDAIIARPHEEWGWTQLGDQRFPALAWNTLNAVLWNRVRLARVDPDPASRSKHSENAGIETFMLDVWVSGVLVLSISWSESDRLTVKTMNRGNWEAEIFGLPVPSRFLGSTLH